MPDFDDELRLLREADPAGSGSIPSATDPGPRALMGRIMMSETPTGRIRSRTGAMIAAAAAIAVIAATGVVAMTRTSSPAKPPAAGPTDLPADNGDAPPNSAAGSMAMCVAVYDMNTIEDREFAFDGTVTSVNEDDVTFTVGEWFKGGSATTITLAGAMALAGIDTADEMVALEPGTRLLVAGDGEFAWGCGFTQPYDAAVAAGWRDAL